MRPGINSYDMTVLPLDVATAMNSRGVITGAVGGDAAVFRNGTVVRLPGKAGYSSLVATAIADNGIIAGHGLSAGHQRPLFWSNETAAALDTGAIANWMSPRAVNSQGIVVGSFEQQPYQSPQAYRWSTTTGISVIAPDTTWSSVAVDISETGYITGYANYQFDGMHAMRWYPDGGIGRIAHGYGQQVFDSGAVAGQGAGSALGLSTLWSLQNAATPIGPDPITHHVRHTNRSGRRVGFTIGATESGTTRAWTARDGQPPVYLPTPAGAHSWANSISDDGAILGSLKLSTGTEQSVLWTKITIEVDPPVFGS